MTQAVFLSGWRYQALVLSVALAAVGYLGVSLWGGWRQVLQAVVMVGVIGSLMVLGLSLANYGIRFIRWQHYLGLLGYQVPWRQSLRIYLAGFALTTTPGKAGEMVRSVFLKSYGVRYTESVGAFVAERVSDLIGVLILAAIGGWNYPAAQPLVIGLGIFLGVGVLALQNRGWLESLGERARGLPRRRLRRVLVSFIEMILHFRSLFALRTTVYGLVLSLIAWGAEAFACYLVANWMGADISFIMAAFIYSFAMLVGAISFLPGGLGSAEAVMIGLFLLVGMEEAQAIACTIFVRVTTLWFALGLGLIALIVQAKGAESASG